MKHPKEIWLGLNPIWKWIISLLLGGALLAFFAWAGDLIDAKGRQFICWLEKTTWLDMNACDQIEQQFRATKTAVCQQGEIRALLVRAAAQRAIRTPESIEEDLAWRTYLCADENWQSNIPTIHLSRLAREYGNCFRFGIDLSEQHSLFQNSKPKFWLPLGNHSNDLCVAPIDKPDGSWRKVNTDKSGRVFCMNKSRFVQNAGTNSTIRGLRRCTRDELTRISVPNGTLNELFTAD